MGHVWAGSRVAEGMWDGRDPTGSDPRGGRVSLELGFQLQPGRVPQELLFSSVKPSPGAETWDSGEVLGLSKLKNRQGGYPNK